MSYCIGWVMKYIRKFPPLKILAYPITMVGKNKVVVVIFLLITIFDGVTCSVVRAQNDHIDAFRDVGMGRALTLLHADTVSKDLPQLIKGSSVVALYDDYAVLNDTYIILNNRSEPISISVGLPRAGYFRTSLIDSVKFSSLPYLSVMQNNETIILKEGSVADSLISNDDCAGVENWYVGHLTLPPDTSVIHIQSLVNTHDSKMLNGRNIEHSHGFGYMTSTLNSWNSDGDFRLLVLSNLTRGEPMQGIYPLHGFKTTDKNYLFDVKLTSDAVPSNVVIRYGSVSMYTPTDKSNIQSISSDPDQLFDEISGVNPWTIKMKNYHPIYLDNFKPFPSASFSIGGIIIAFALLFGTIIFFLVRSGMGQIRHMKRQEKKD